MASRSMRSEIVDDLDYQNAPKSVDASVLEQWVAAYRAGDDSYRDQIIRAHLRTVKMTADVVAARYRKFHLKVDLVQEAFTIMLVAIDEAREKLIDNLITPYITSTVRHRLVDYISKERCVYMPARTFRDKKAKGQEIKGLAFEASVFSRECNSNADLDNSNRDVTYTMPIARRTTVLPEFAEAMSLAIVTEEERKVIDLKIEGYTHREFETLLGLGRTEVSQIIRRVRRRFNAHYA